jgi:hypothetical protein
MKKWDALLVVALVVLFVVSWGRCQGFKHAFEIPGMETGDRNLAEVEYQKGRNRHGSKVGNHGSTKGKKATRPTVRVGRDVGSPGGGQS